MCVCFCVQVLVTMQNGGEDYKFVWVNDMGITNAYNPTTASGDHQTIVFVSMKTNM